MIAKPTAREGAEDDVLAVFDALREQVDSEGGTEPYVLHRDARDEPVLRIYEPYEDWDALVAHGRSDAMRRALAELEPLLEATEPVQATPLSAKGPAL